MKNKTSETTKLEGGKLDLLFGRVRNFGHRRALIALLLALLTIGSTGYTLFHFTFDTRAAATFVKSAEGSAKTATSANATFASAPTSGNLLIAVVATRGNIVINPISGWTTAINQNSVGFPSQAIFYKISNGTETTVTGTTSTTANSIGIHIYEYSGVTGVLAQTSSATGTATGTPSAGTLTTTEADQLMFAAFVDDINTGHQNASWSDVEGFTEIHDFKTTGSGTNATYAGGHRLTSPTGSYTVTTTIGSTANTRGQALRFTATSPTFEQSAYRLFANANSTDVGSALAAQNTAATLTTGGEAFRLRQLLHIGTHTLPINSTKQFKLQFAERSGTCDAAFVGETYADVTASTLIAYNDNATPADGATLTANANDPTHSGHTIVNQTYEELNNFRNTVAAIPAGQDGKWDFSLRDNGAPANTAYCFRVVQSTGTVLNTYTVIPEITTASPVYNQSAYRFFSNTNSTDVGLPLSAQDTGAVLTTNGQAFRLRKLLHVTNKDAPTSFENFKLQFAVQSGSCDTGFVGETYADVTGGTAIAYNDNLVPADGAALTANASDPTHSGHTIRNQTYEELNNFTNSQAAINVGEDGKWDFALVDNDGASSVTYCLRAVKSNGTPFSTYTVIPQITTFVVGNTPPTGSWNSATQKTDGSGEVDLSIEVDDGDDDNTRALIEYETDSDGACNGPWAKATLLGPATADFDDSGGAPDVTNANAYQVGSTATTRIITSSGSNTVDFDWDSDADLPSANGTQCLRLTVNDNTADQNTPATRTVAVDNVDPTVTAGNANIDTTNCTGTAGVCKVGDTITFEWNNSGGGDNNSDVTLTSQVEFDLSEFGASSTQQPSAVVGGVFDFDLVLTSGAIDASGLTFDVTATDATGNSTGPITSTDTASVDNQPAVVTAGNISTAGATGTGGAFIVGDTVTVTWNNSAGGDNNTDTLTTIQANLSAWGGSASATMTDTTACGGTNGDNIYEACFTLVSGAIDTTTAESSVTVTDNAGNVTGPVLDGQQFTVDNQPAVVTAGNISTAGATGTGGAFIVGDTVTVTWNNSAGGDNNADTLASVLADLSDWGGSASATMTDTTACGGTAGDDIYEACFTLTTGSIDATDAESTVTVTDNAGNATGPVADGATFTVDNQPPVVTAGNISVGADGTGTGGAFIAGDTVTVTWNNSGGGDNNADTLTSTLADLSDWGGSATATMTDTTACGGTASDDIYEACFTLVSGSIDTTTAEATVTVTDNAGNSTGPVADGATFTVDNDEPNVTAGNISTAGATGTGGAFIVGDTVTVTWNASAGGDNETDTLASVLADLSDWGGSATSNMTDTTACGGTNGDDIYEACFTLVSGSIDSTTAESAVTVTDNAGNATGPVADGATFTVDNQEPVVTAGNISVGNDGTGTGGAFIVGDTVTVTWDNSGGGDNNADIASATADLSDWGGSSAAAMTDTTACGGTASDDIYEACFTLISGSIDTTTAEATVTATDDAGNATGPVADGATFTVDNDEPNVTAGNISTAGGTGTGGAFIVGDTVTVTWNASAGGDNENDTLSTIQADLSDWGGSATATMTDTTACGGTASDDIYEACFTLISGSIDSTTAESTVTVTDNAGNTTGPAADGQTFTVDNQEPVVTAGNISVGNDGSGTGGAFIVGDTVTVTWNNSAGGDNNADISSATANLSDWGGSSTATMTDTTACGGTAADDIYEACFTLISGSIDVTDAEATVTATDDAGNSTGPVADGATFTVDNQEPIVTAGNISVGADGTGTGGAFIVGDTVTVTWDNSGGGDNNPDTISAVVSDLSDWGGSSTATMTDTTACGGTASDDIYEACFTLISGSIDVTDAEATVTATDNAGNATGPVADGATFTVDNQEPVVTAGNISTAGATGTGGAFIIGDTVTVTWNNSGGGDNNADTLASVLADLSDWGGSVTASMTDTTACGGTNGDGIYEACFTLVSGTIDTTTAESTVTVTDNAGNATGPVADGTTFTVDTNPPNLTTWTLNMAAETLTLIFDESVDASTLAVGGITVQDAATAGTTYTLTDSTTASGDGTTIVVDLSATDLAGLEGDDALATAVTDSYLRITATVIDDLRGNDNVAIADGSAQQVFTYTPDTEWTQQAYRLFNNADSTDVGSALATQDTAGTLATNGDTFRLRALVHHDVSDVSASGKTYKLQFAVRSGACDIGFSGETYADVTAATAIAYNDNATPADGATLTGNASDPTHGGDTVVDQTYEELNNFTNSVATVEAGEDGMWDFVLIDNDGSTPENYCFRIVDSSGSTLDAYSVIPEIATVTGNSPPTGAWNSATQKTDGSGDADLSIEVDDGDDDDTRAQVEYETDSDGACDGPWSAATLVGPATADFDDSGGAPDVNNGNTYQVGSTATTRIITTSGSNTVDFDWDSDTDLPSADGNQCLRLTVNDDTADQTTPDTIVIAVDNVDPTVTAGNLTIDDTACTGTGGVCIVGDTITFEWDNSGSGDNNSDITATNQVDFDLSEFGGSATQEPDTLAAGGFSFDLTLTSGTIDAAGLTFDVTATDGAGNSTGPITSTDTASVDNDEPNVTAGNISVGNDGSGTGGAFIPGDVVTITWDGSAGGDNETDALSSIQADLSDWGGSSTATMTDTTACGGTNGDGIYEACFTLISGSIDSTTAEGTVTVTDNAGNVTGPVADGATFTVDNQEPTVTSGNISVGNDGTGTGGAFIPGDTVTVTWNNSAGGDNNADIASATADLSDWGGSSTSTMTDTTACGGTAGDDIYEACFTLVSGSIDTTTAEATVTATDDAGNATGPVADGATFTVDNQEPVVTAGNISVGNDGTGTGGAFIVGDTVTVTWNNSAGGDNNADTLAAITADLSDWGGSSTATMTDTTACGGTAGDDIYEACFTLVSGSIDVTDAEGTVTVTDNAGNATGQVADGATFTVDNQPPVVTAGNISVGNDGTGTGSAFIVGDTVTVTWNNSAGGDNNTDTLSSITADLSDWGGSSTAVMTDTTACGGTASDDIYEACFTLVSGSIDVTDAEATVTATDNAGNATGPVADGATFTVDNQELVVTAGNISVGNDGTGTGGAFIPGDTVTVTWNNSAGGDNNADTIASATADLSDWGGSAAAAMTDTTACGGTASDDIYEACFTLVSGSIDTTTAEATVTATDNAGNATGPVADGATFTVDTQEPTVTAGNISVGNDGSGTGGAFIPGDVVTVTWNNSGGGDNNADLASATADLSDWGGSGTAAMTDTTACGGTASDDIYEACFTLISGSIDTTTAEATVTATDDAGNATGPVADGATFTVDTQEPVVTAGNISVGNDGSGTGGAFIPGDVVTVTWNNSAGGDNNADFASATADLSDWGGSSTTTMTDTTACGGTASDDIYEACFTLISGSIDTTTAEATVTATDDAGNATGPVADGATFTVDTQEPTVTAGNISVAGASGVGGAFIIGDTATVTWNNAGGGDNNADLASATADLTDWGGSSTATMTDTTACGGTAGDDIYEACFTLVAGAIDTTTAEATVTATDDAGNVTGPVADGATFTVDTNRPTLSTWNLDMAAETLTLIWDESVDASTLTVTGITVQDAATAGASYTLTDSTTASGDGTTIVIDLSATDLAALEADDALATASDDSYIRITAVVIDDLRGNDNDTIADGAAQQVFTYTPDTEWTQQAYRFYNNTDSTDVGTVLAAQDTTATLATNGDAFRLRALVHHDVSDVATSGKTYKLQFAVRSGTCDVSFTGETYADVTAATAIAYNDNGTPADGATLTGNANDPTHGGDTVVDQTYEELNNFTNSVATVEAGEDGLWDFALIDNDGASAENYCFRIVDGSGSILDTYSVIPEIVTVAGNSPPTGSWNSTVQKTDGSGDVDLSIEVNDADTDDTRAQVEYETDSDGACDGPWAAATLTGPATADFDDSGGAPDVNNGNTYQVGSTATTRIITSSGSNTVDFDWDSDTDLPTADGTQCLRLTVNDDTVDQTTPDTMTLNVDNVDPTVTAGSISVGADGTGTGGAFIPGDTVTLTWDNSAGGDNNSDVNTATADLSDWGGSSTATLTDTTACGGTAGDAIYEACFTLTSGSIDVTDAEGTVTVTDTTGNSTGPVADGATFTVDNDEPNVTAGNISVGADGSGTGGAFIPGDVVTITWDGSAGGDNETDTLASVLADLSDWGGSSTATMTDTTACGGTNGDGIYEACFTLISGSIDSTTAEGTVTVTDNAGNATGPVADGATFTVDTQEPVVTAGNISVGSDGSGTGGAFIPGDVVTVTWNNSAGGDNNADISSATADLSDWGGSGTATMTDTTACGGTASDDIYEACFTLISGSIDTTTAEATVTATDDAGNATGPVADGATFTVDNQEPTVTAGNISVGNDGSGTGGAFIPGDVVTVTWNNSAGGDNNADIASVTADLSDWGGSGTATMTDTTACGGTNGDDIYEACFTLTSGSIDTTTAEATVTATDDAGNAAGPVADGATFTVDTQEPVVTAGNISVGNDGSGTGGAFIPGDVVTVTWNNSAGGDNNADIASVTADLSDWGGSGTATMTDTTACGGTASDDIFEACFTLVSGSIDTTTAEATVTATDDAGNAAGPVADGATFTVDTQEPVVTAGNISVGNDGSGTGGAFIPGDVVTVTWNNSAGGDNNADISSATADLSDWGGSGTAAMTDTTACGGTASDDIFEACFTLTSGSIDTTTAEATVTATDDAGNATGPVADGATFTVDNQAPTVTSGEISLSGATGVSGAFIIGDTAVVTWDNSAGGDNNADIASATADLSDWGGSATAAMTDTTACGGTASDDIYEACITLAAGAIDTTSAATSVTATDDAGNDTTTADDGTFTVDTNRPTLSTWNLDMAAETLTLIWDESVDASTLTVTGITVQDAATAGTSYTLTDSTTASGDGTSIVVDLSATDLAALEADDALATSSTDSYITITTAVIDDLRGNDNDAIADGAGQQVFTYTGDPEFTQQAYRLFNNADSTDVGSALAAQDTPATLATNADPFRLRMLIHHDISDVASSGQTYKLQFATRSGACDTSFTGETYADVTLATAIRYNDNATPADGAALTGNANDPTHGGDTVVDQTYEELNNFTNSVATVEAGEDGLWDFSLIDGDGGSSNSYCFRIVESGGAVLDTYSVIPEITTTAAVGNTPPSGAWNSATQKTDGSGDADLSIEIDDDDDDDTRAQIEYETDSDGACDGPWAAATLVGPATADFNDSGGAPDVNNGNTYQVGSTATTRIITSSGSNTVDFDWDSDTDLPSADGTQCLRLTANDDTADQTTPATRTITVDNVDPTVTAGNISVAATATGTGGAFIPGDTVTVTWDNSAGGDNNSDLNTGTADLSDWGGSGTAVLTDTTACGGTAGDGIYEACYTLVSGSIDVTDAEATVTATDTTGNSTGPIADGATFTVDTDEPNVTAGNISVGNDGSGTGGAFIPGDVVTITWDGSAGGDNETDTLATIQADLSDWGGSSTATMTDTTACGGTNGDGIYEACFTLISGSIDSTTAEGTVTVTDNAGNTTGPVADGATFTIDNQEPTVTAGEISVAATGSGTGGAFVDGDTVTVTWDNSGAGDNNADISSASADLSDWGGSSTATMTDTTACGGTVGDDIYEACFNVVSGSIDTTTAEATVTATDDAGNDTGPVADGATFTVDTEDPTVTAGNISVGADGTGTGGAFIVGDTVTVTWNNAGGGDNNADIASAIADLSDWGGSSTATMTDTTACGGTAADDIYEACFTLVSGSIDTTTAEAEVTATDDAGNDTGPVADGQQFTVDTDSPSVSAVVVSPSSGTVGVGDTVTVTITDSDSETGLNVGTCTLNGVDVSGSFTDNANGTYTITYTLVEGNSDWTAGNLPISCELEDDAGNSDTASAFTDGNTLAGDANSPTITDVEVVPATGTLTDGQAATVTLTAGGLETGLSVGSCTVNSKNVAGTFVDNTDGTYTLTYTVASGDSTWTAGNLSVSCALTDAGDNSATANAFTDGNTLAGNPSQPSGGGGGGGSTSLKFPSGTAISFAQGSCTASQNVTLNLSGNQANQVIVSNNSQFIGASWQTFTSPFMQLPFVLTSGDGTKTVYAMWKSSTGNNSNIASATIDLDTATACGTIQPPPPPPPTDPEDPDTPEEPETPITPPGPAPALCPVNCSDVKFDLYIVNPDGTRRHSGTQFARTEFLSAANRIVNFEDKGDDFDYNDVVIEINRTDCRAARFTLRALNAGWDHQVRVAVFHQGQFWKDIQLWQSTQTAVVNQPSVTIDAANDVVCAAEPEEPLFTPEIPGELDGLLGQVSCEVDCRRVGYNLYIVNPDGTRREINTDFVVEEEIDTNVTLYQFEDRGVDVDHDDIWIYVDRRVCEEIKTTIVDLNAGWHHQIGMELLYDGVKKSDVLLWHDSHLGLGQDRVIHVNDFPAMCEVQGFGERTRRAFVTVYEHINFTGRSETFFVGEDGSLTDNVILDNTISSIRFFGGAIGRFFTNFLFGGVNQVFTKDVADLRAKRVGNDTISSIRVYGPARPPAGEIGVPQTSSPQVCVLNQPITSLLTPGNSGDTVLRLQVLLQCLGFIAPEVELTGFYGPATTQAITDLQSENGLDPLGFVGPGTRGILNSYVQ